MKVDVKSTAMLIDLAAIREQYIPLGRSTIFRMISAGTFPTADVKQGAKIRLWRRDKIESWVDKQQQPRLRRGRR